MCYWQARFGTRIGEVPLHMESGSSLRPNSNGINIISKGRQFYYPHPKPVNASQSISRHAASWLGDVIPLVTGGDVTGVEISLLFTHAESSLSNMDSAARSKRALLPGHQQYTSTERNMAISQISPRDFASNTSSSWDICMITSHSRLSVLRLSDLSGWQQLPVL